MSLAELDTFDEQKRAAFIMSIVDKLTKRSNRLLEFGSVMKDVAFSGQHDLGVQPVSLDRIVGTMGRSEDFDRAFRPRRADIRRRWVSVYRALYQDKLLPPVELYKVGDCYFVQDGHHRVSVGRASHQAYIDAHVIEIEPDASRTTHTCARDN